MRTLCSVFLHKCIFSSTTPRSLTSSIAKKLESRIPLVLSLPIIHNIFVAMTVAMKRKLVKACSPIKARKRRHDIVLPADFERLVSSVEAMRSRLNAITDTQSTCFDSIEKDLTALESEMLIARNKLISPRIKAVCADVLLFALGVNPKKSSQKSYFTARKRDRRVASRAEAFLDCQCFAGRNRNELAADFDLAISSGLGSFHLQNKADLIAEVNICLRMFAAKPVLQDALRLQYCILKDFVHFSPLL